MDRAPSSSGHSLGGSLLRLLSAAVLLAALVQAGLIYRLTRAEADEVFDAQLRQVALTLQGMAAAPVADPGFRRPFDDDGLGLVIRVWAADGSSRFQSGDRVPLPAAPEDGFSRVAAAGRPYRVYSVRTAAAVIEVAQDLHARGRMAAGLAVKAVLPALALVPLLMAAVWLLVRRATRPLLRVQGQVASRAAEDLSPLPAAGLPDEVLPLVAEINLLFSRLDRSFAAQRDFVADAAHELRTPLAALRLQVQGLQRAGTGPAQAQAAARLLEGVDRATRLVEQMLLLARQEAAAEAGAAARVDLVAVAALAIADALPSARAKGIDLGLEEGAAGTVLGQEGPLRILLRNLLENAVNYTPAGGTVDLAIRAEGDRVALVVADSGPGIPAAERERVFDRFYRLPGQEGLGNGLGLAIVKAVAERHQGRVGLGRSDRLGGLEIAVSLPPAPAAPG